MNIIRENRNTDTTLEKFADENQLDLVLTTYSWGIAAAFRNSDIKDGSFLTGVYGRGDTEEVAIEDYRKSISSRLLVIDACGSNRREIIVPNLISVK